MEKEVYKVLIADDEYWTREKLCSMIDWSRYSLCCMEPAADGKCSGALKQISRIF